MRIATEAVKNKMAGIVSHCTSSGVAKGSVEDLAKPAAWFGALSQVPHEGKSR
jgi:hypothetical protein